MAAHDDKPERRVRLRFDVPEDLKVGLYANELNVWHTPFEFTLDFAVAEPPEVDDPDDPASTVTIPTMVVARVRVPVGLIFGVMQALNRAMTTYEGRWGTIKAPEWRGRSEEDA